MANQIVVSSGAKVRDLNDVIIGTSGVLSSLAFNVSNGVPKLDVNGKILVSQLPNSVMEYLGTWNAATNTPFLVNGTGNAGDVYLCNVAGTVDFGAGPISFVVSDQVIYSGSIWQKASGSNGTVTSVGLTSTGNDAITITGSPITTSGNINLGFAGTNLQYINGAGDLTTFPTLLSSVGLSMPSAFSVSNSPLTANGTIAVTGAGYPSQYIRGDGTLADFPSSGGGGSSVSYYLNGGTSQGTIGGVTYYEMSKIADTGTGVDFPKTGDGLIVSFLTDANDPAQLNIPAGNWNYEIYASMSSNGGTPQLYAELYVYDGTTFTLISTSSNEILYDGTNLNLYTFAMTVPATTLALTDRLAVKLYATNSGGKTTTVHTQDSHLCQIITTFSTGITALNGLTAQVQYFATGTSGTDFAISSSTATHTFNLPVASASNTGKLSSTDWSTFNGKESVLTFSSPLVRTTNTISIPAATTSVNGYLTSTDWTTFNSKQATISLTTTGTSGAATFVSNTLNIPNYGSALSGYLPLSGGTLTGLLNGTSADFSSSVSALELLLDSAGTASATFVKNTNGTGVISTGANQIGFNLNNAFFITSDNKGCSIFSFNHSSSSYTYTLPSANGTIALVGGSGVGTVTSVAALTLGTTGTDLSSTVANSTTTPVITLNVPTASATNRGALSSADWTTFNNKQAALTNPVTGTGTTNTHAKFTSTSVIGNSMVSDDGTTLTSTGATRSNLYIKAANNTQYSQLAFANGTNASTGGLSYNNASQYMQFETNTSEWMRLMSDGKLGIGTTSPAYTLDVSGTFRTTSDVVLGGGSTIFGTTGSKFYIYPAFSTNLNLLQNYNGSAYTTEEHRASDYSYKIGTTAAMTITSAGNVGIGNTGNSTIRLYLTGVDATSSNYTIYANSSTTNLFYIRNDGLFVTGTASTSPINNTTASLANANIGAAGDLRTSTASSERFKDNIADWSGNGLETILALKPRTFNYKADYYKHPKVQMLGLIAEEVAEVSEYLAEYENEDRTGQIENVRYANIVVPLIKAVQEMNTKLDEQNQTIQNLQEQINILAK